MVDVSVTEFISTLSHSTAPTLIIEGKGDYAALEDFENENVSWGFTVLPVHGKQNVLELIDRRVEISNPNILFLVDQDEWLLCGTPSAYKRADVIFTIGAAMENDLILDGEPWKLMSLSEQSAFKSTTIAFAVVYTRLVADHLSGNVTYNLRTHPLQFFDVNGLLDVTVGAWAAAHPSPTPVPAYLVGKPEVYIRGKSLLALVTMQLSSPTRKSRFGKANIMEIGLRARGANSKAHETAILKFFA